MKDLIDLLIPLRLLKRSPIEIELERTKPYCDGQG